MKHIVENLTHKLEIGYFSEDNETEDFGAEVTITDKKTNVTLTMKFVRAELGPVIKALQSHYDELCLTMQIESMAKFRIGSEL